VGDAGAARGEWREPDRLATTRFPSAFRPRARTGKCSAWPPRIGSLDGLVVRPARVEDDEGDGRRRSANRSLTCRPLRTDRDRRPEPRAERRASPGASRTRPYSDPLSQGHACTCDFAANWIPIVKKKTYAWLLQTGSLGGQFKQQPATHS
jgi:hypothetical protein